MMLSQRVFCAPPPWLGALAALAALGCSPMMSNASGGGGDLSAEAPVCRDLPTCKDTPGCEESLEDLTIRLNMLVPDDEAIIDFIRIPKGEAFELAFAGLSQAMRDAWDRRGERLGTSEVPFDPSSLSHLQYVGIFENNIWHADLSKSTWQGSFGGSLPTIGRVPVLLKRLISRNDRGRGRHWQHTFIVSAQGAEPSPAGYHFRRLLPTTFTVPPVAIANDGDSGNSNRKLEFDVRKPEDVSEAYQTTVMRSDDRPWWQVAAAGATIATFGLAGPAASAITTFAAAGTVAVQAGKVALVVLPAFGAAQAASANVCRGDAMPPDIAIARSLFVREVRRESKYRDKETLVRALTHLNDRLTGGRLFDQTNPVTAWSDKLVKSMGADAEFDWKPVDDNLSNLMRSLTLREKPIETVTPRARADKAREACEGLTTDSEAFKESLNKAINSLYSIGEELHAVEADPNFNSYTSYVNPGLLELLYALIKHLLNISNLCDLWQDFLVHPDNAQCVEALMDWEHQSLLGTIMEKLYENDWNRRYDLQQGGQAASSESAFDLLDGLSAVIDGTFTGLGDLSSDSAADARNRLRAEDARNRIAGALYCMERLAGTGRARAVEENLPQNRKVSPQVKFWWGLSTQRLAVIRLYGIAWGKD